MHTRPAPRQEGDKRPPPKPRQDTVRAPFRFTDWAMI